MTTEEKRANLFSLTQDILAIDRLLDELDDPEAELTQEQRNKYSLEVSKFLDDVARARDEKIDGYCMYVRKLESEQKGLESIAREFSEKASRRKARIDLLKARLVDHLKSVGQVKVATERNTVSWQHNGGVVPIEIVDAEEIPARYCKLVPSNTLVREALEAGEEVPGAVMLERGCHLRIR